MENCKGCYSHISRSVCAVFSNIIVTGKCPCGVCLIKMVCKIPCKEYTKFWQKAITATYGKEYNKNWQRAITSIYGKDYGKRNI